MESDSSNIPLSHTITASCRKCSKTVFQGYNSWLKVTRTYYLPAFAGSYNLFGVEATGQSRPAFDGTALSSCQIQPLSCSSCHETLGITCSNTPDDKTRFKNRQLFKLARLSLTSLDTRLKVEAIEEKAMLEEHRTENVVHHVDHASRRLASPSMNAPLPANAASAGPSRVLEPQRHTSSPAQHGGHHYRQPVEELLAQLSSQLSVHSNILEDQRHQIERLDVAVQRLQQEQNYVFNAMREMKIELQTRPPQTQPDSPDASEIDILTDQLQAVASKANEVDGLKVEINIMRRQLRRLDRHHDRVASPGPSGLSSVEPSAHDHPSHPPPQQAQPSQKVFSIGTPSSAEPRSILYQTPAENRLPPPILPNAEPRALNDQHPSTTESRTLPGFRSIDPTTSSVSSWRPAGGYTPVQTAPAPPSVSAPTSTPHNEAPAVSGWAAVNATSAPKRPVPGDGHFTALDAPQPGSPKRQRLAPLMPRVSYGDQTSTGASSPYQPGATPDSLPPVPSLANSRNPSNESAGSLPPPSNPLRFVLSTQDAPTEDSWRPESQRQAVEAGRGGARDSPRRGGRGGGIRGRGRKSGGPEELGTPEWEQPEWTGSQIPPGGFYQPGTEPPHRGNIVRRGGGVIGATLSERPSASAIPGVPVAPGGPAGPGGPGGSERPAGSDPQVPHTSLYPDPHFMSLTTTADVASSTAGSTSGQPTKKTRTKPIRNADGVLIRKDGRPDMRSVSSAMNLKKVHAKKEAERQSKEASVDDKDRSGTNGGTPHSHSEHDPDNRGGSGSPSRHALSERDGQEDDTSDEEEEEEEPNHGHSTQDRHAANMRKIFPYGFDDGVHPANNIAQAFFPPTGLARGPPEVTIRAAESSDDAHHGRAPVPGPGGVVPSMEKAGGQTAERERMAEGAAAAAAGRREEEGRDVEMTDGA